MKENIAPNVVDQKHQLKLVYIGDFEIEKGSLNGSLLRWFGQASDARLKEGSQLTFLFVKTILFV